MTEHTGGASVNPAFFYSESDHNHKLLTVKKPSIQRLLIYCSVNHFQDLLFESTSVFLIPIIRIAFFSEVCTVIHQHTVEISDIVHSVMVKAP